MPCNAALGQLKDNPEFLKAAIAYLERGRLAPPPDLPVDSPRGETHGNTKFTTEQVLEIRAIHAAGGVTYAELGRRYGVTDVTISNIVRRKTWDSV